MRRMAHSVYTRTKLNIASTTWSRNLRRDLFWQHALNRISATEDKATNLLLYLLITAVADKHTVSHKKWTTTVAVMSSYLNRYLARNVKKLGIMQWSSLSVCPSHTHESRLNGYQIRFAQYDRALYPVYWGRISSSRMYGFTPNECVKAEALAVSRKRCKIEDKFLLFSHRKSQAFHWYDTAWRIEKKVKYFKDLAAILDAILKIRHILTDFWPHNVEKS